MKISPNKLISVLPNTKLVEMMRFQKAKHHKDNDVTGSVSTIRNTAADKMIKAGKKDHQLQNDFSVARTRNTKAD